MQLGVGVFLVVGVEVILCILISSVANPAPIKIVIDSLRPFYDYTICSFSSAWFALIAILGAYNLIIMVIGVYLAIRIRVIPYSMCVDFPHHIPLSQHLTPHSGTMRRR
jgi:hypothetical protein